MNHPRADQMLALTPEMISRFGALKKRLSTDIRSISELYVNSTPRSLIYRPVGHLDVEELAKGRARLLATGKVELAGIEVALNLISDTDPTNRRRKGAFRVLEWYTSDFVPTLVPPSVEQRRELLDRESGWLKGGPK